jgi:RNA polymerase sigma-70 factor (ECF subfamily)
MAELSINSKIFSVIGGKVTRELAKSKDVDSLHELDDKSLVSGAQNGDSHAYQELVERYQKRALSVAIGLCGNPQDAEDLVQEAFLKAYKNLNSFRGTSSFYTWLYRIVYNLAIDLSRKAYRKSEFSSDDISTADAISRNSGNLSDAYIGKVSDPEQYLRSQEIRQSFSKALAELSEEHRIVIVLREIDGLSYTEISDVIGCSKGTVMSRLHHARKKLQAALIDLV